MTKKEQKQALILMPYLQKVSVVSNSRQGHIGSGRNFNYPLTSQSITNANKRRTQTS